MSWVNSNTAAITTHKDVHRRCGMFAYFALKEYEKNMLIYNRKNMQGRFFFFLRERRCNSLRHPSLHYEVGVDR